MVWMNPAPGRSDDFNKWSNQHVDEAVKDIPEIVSGQRYRLSPVQRAGTRPGQWEYLTLFGIDGDDDAVGRAAATALAEAGDPDPADSAVATDHATWVYTALSDRQDETEAAKSAKPRLGSGRHAFIALTNPSVGREDDFLRWYDAHIPEVLEGFAGLVTGRFFRASDAQPAGMAPTWKYLALYDLLTDDVSEYLRLETSSHTPTEDYGSLDPQYAVWIYSEL
jgi:hypothetical protein